MVSKIEKIFKKIKQMSCYKRSNKSDEKGESGNKRRKIDNKNKNNIEKEKFVNKESETDNNNKNNKNKGSDEKKEFVNTELKTNNNENKNGGYIEQVDEITESSSKKQIQNDFILEKFKKEIKQKNDKIKQLEEEKNKDKKEAKEDKNRIVELEQKAKEDKNRIDELEQQIKEQLETHKNSEAQHKEKSEKRVNGLEQHTSQELIDSLKQELNERMEELRKLEEKNTELRKEASRYQSALGSATNTRLGDEESVKLRSDILDLQKTLETFVTNLKPNMEIDYEQVKIIAENYGCQSPVNAKNKPFIKALLQRKVLDEILYLFKEYNNEGEDIKLETGIETKAQELLGLIEKFSTSRSGTDEIVNVAAVKVRQQVYGILGNRGFANVIDPNGSHVHNFIIFVSDKLNNMVNKYRKIGDPAKKKEAESIAPKLIQDIYKLFYYRLNVQEPKSEYKFCESGSSIDQNIMKGRWDDDDVDQLYVDICYFPIIGRDLESSEWKIYVQAKVFPRNSSGTGETG